MAFMRQCVYISIVCVGTASGSLSLVQQRAARLLSDEDGPWVEELPRHEIHGSGWNDQVKGSQFYQTPAMKIDDVPQARPKWQQEQMYKDVQSFVQSTPGGNASIVLFGDSTMAGLARGLLNVSDEVVDSMELVFVANGRPKRSSYRFFKWNIKVPSGKEFVTVNETVRRDPLINRAIMNSQNAINMLWLRDCKSGGGLETYVLRSGPYKNLVVYHWPFIPEYTDFCWEECVTNAMKALQPTAVVWNVGFHLLNHDFSASVCKQRYNPTKKNCGNYQEMVSLATNSMLQSGIPNVVWKTTNWLCEKRQTVGFPSTAKGLEKWHDEAKRPLLEQWCKRDCPQYAEAGLDSCYDWFFDARASHRMYNESMEALAQIKTKATSGIHVLDAFQKTKSCCEAGCEEETQDGEHYDGLDNDLAARLVGMLSGRLADDAAWLKPGMFSA